MLFARSPPLAADFRGRLSIEAFLPRIHFDSTKLRISEGADITLIDAPRPGSGLAKNAGQGSRSDQRIERAVGRQLLAGFAGMIPGCGAGGG